jgi:hypothetical protein
MERRHKSPGEYVCRVIREWTDSSERQPGMSYPLLGASPIA